MVILGIDPGYAIVGYGIVESARGRFRPLSTERSSPRPGLILTAGLKKSMIPFPL